MDIPNYYNFYCRKGDVPTAEHTTAPAKTFFRLEVYHVCSIQCCGTRQAGFAGDAQEVLSFDRGFGQDQPAGCGQTRGGDVHRQHRGHGRRGGEFPDDHRAGTRQGQHRAVGRVWLLLAAHRDRGRGNCGGGEGQPDQEHIGEVHPRQGIPAGAGCDHLRKSIDMEKLGSLGASEFYFARSHSLLSTPRLLIGSQTGYYL